VWKLEKTFHKEVGGKRRRKLERDCFYYYRIFCVRPLTLYSNLQCVDKSGCAEGEKEKIGWNEFENSQIIGGVKNSTARSVPECQKACELNTSCDGLDWDPRQNEGDRCWLHGHWSSNNRVEGSANGITHYDINRTGICISMLLYFH